MRQLFLSIPLQYIYFVAIPALLELLLVYLWIRFAKTSILGFLFCIPFFLMFVCLNGAFVAEYRRFRQFWDNQNKHPNDASPYFLFLRSFSKHAGYLTDAIYTSTSYIGGTRTVSSGIIRKSLVSNLEQAVKATGAKLLVLGGNLVLRPDNEIIWLQCEDEAWWTNFQILAVHSKGIIVSPADSPGLVEELSFIKEHALLRNTIFVMAPIPSRCSDVPDSMQAYPDREKAERVWNEAKILYGNIGICLPAYDWHGLIFVLDDRGMVERSVYLYAKEDVATICSALNEMQGGLSCTPRKVKDVYRLLNLRRMKKPDGWLIIEAPGTDEELKRLLFLSLRVLVLGYVALLFLI